jgi:ABC-2 type transport system ATP-binding protein
MEELPGMYSEVLVSPENIEQALKYSPIHSREILGKRSMIFEDVSADMLGNFGEVHTPSVADLFVAKMQKG